MSLPYPPETLMLAALVVPFLASLLTPLLGRWPKLRETMSLTASAFLVLVVWSLAPQVLAGARPEMTLIQVVPGLTLAFAAEPLGMLFALVAGSLWFISVIYTIGFMSSGRETRQSQFYACFGIAIASAMGVAFAKNLFTLFVFYEILTLSTYPLVTHRATPDAMRGGRLYLLVLLGTSMVLLLPAIIATGVLAGTLDFTPGGILDGKTGPMGMGLLLALFVFGIGKAALMPFHFWLPAAMVAPAPVSALLHAVAVVKAGVFTVLKVLIFVFGLETVAQTPATSWLILVAIVTLIGASLMALGQDNIKARLAYSTVSQLAYVVLGGLIAVNASVIGAGMHIAMHAAGKITLFFCAGAIFMAAKKTLVSELDGLGRMMPFTMGAFFVASLSIIGIPPLGGSWSKFYLVLGALEADQMLAVGALMLSSLLSVAYLMPIVARAFFRTSGDVVEGRAPAINEAPTSCVIALCLTALMCFALFFGATFFEQLMAAALSIPGTMPEGPSP